MTTPETELLLSGSPMKKPSYSGSKAGEELSGFDNIIDEYAIVAPGARRLTPVKLDPVEAKTQASFFFTCFNLGNDILGSSIICARAFDEMPLKAPPPLLLIESILAAQPYFVAELGFWFAPFVYVLFAIITTYTLNLLYYLCHTYNVDNYPRLCEHALGKPGLFIACFCIFMFNWGGLLASVLIIGTGIPSILDFIFNTSTKWISREYVLMYCALLFLPLSFFKNLSSYAFNSFLSLMGLAGVAILVAVRSFVTHVSEHRPVYTDRLPFFGRDPLPALGGLSFMFVCHDLSINVHQELRDKTPRRWSLVVIIVLALIMCVWWTIITGGYFLFYSDSADNILTMFPSSDYLIIAARGLLCLTIVVSIPYSLFMPRVSLYAMLKLLLGNRLDVDVFHILSTTFLCMSCFIIGLFVTNLGVLFELIGSISAVSLAYILPPLCFLALEPPPWYRRSKLLAIAVLCFGLFCMIGGTGKIIIGLFTGTKK